MKNYKTRQGEIILHFLQSKIGTHVKAADIKEHFIRENISIGLTTIYRHLARLENEGRVHKYILDNSGSACFEYIDQGEACKEVCFHLKCEECEKLIHFDCEMLKDIDRHMFEEHQFYLNPKKTVYYGCCKDCKENLNEKHRR